MRPTIPNDKAKRGKCQECWSESLSAGPNNRQTQRTADLFWKSATKKASYCMHDNKSWDFNACLCTRWHDQNETTWLKFLFANFKRFIFRLLTTRSFLALHTDTFKNATTCTERTPTWNTIRLVTQKGFLCGDEEDLWLWRPCIQIKSEATMRLPSTHITLPYFLCSCNKSALIDFGLTSLMQFVKVFHLSAVPHSPEETPPLLSWQHLHFLASNEIVLVSSIFASQQIQKC